MEGYIKETITFFRPALMGRKYLNTVDCNFKGQPDGDYYIVEENAKPETIQIRQKQNNETELTGEQELKADIS